VITGLAVAVASGGITFSGSLVLTLIAVLTFLVTAAGIAGGSWKIQRNTQTVAVYKQAAEAWEAKSKAQDAHIETQDDQIIKLGESMAEKDRQIAELRGQISTLQDMVTGRSAVEAMDARLAAGIEQSARILQVVQGIATQISAAEAG
jgi:uncharacterized protein HemX